MGVTKVLVVDDNKDLREVMTSFLMKFDGIQVVDTATDGVEALEKLELSKPDVIVLDSIMPKLDGFGFLEELRSKNIKIPKTIMVTANASDETVAEAMSLGVSHFMAKPFDMNSLAKRIKNTHNPIVFKSEITESVNFDLETEITSILKDVGVPAHIRGYSFMRESITLAVHNPDVLNYITKGLYPQVASKNATTASRVERAIRHAIEVAWARGSYEQKEKLFGYTIDADRGKPTNSEFIALISDKLRLEMKKYNVV